MCTLDLAPRGPVKTKFSPVDAARLALEPSLVPVGRTPRRDRLLRMATSMWCRQLQFPTVRQLVAEGGWTSTSTVTAGFGGLIYLQAEVIRGEWNELERWSGLPAADRTGALVDHAEHLAAMDPACLRLPGLVWSAVTIADPAREGDLELALHVHALAALAGCLAPRTRLGVPA